MRRTTTGRQTAGLLHLLSGPVPQEGVTLFRNLLRSRVVHSLELSASTGHDWSCRFPSSRPLARSSEEKLEIKRLDEEIIITDYFGSVRSKHSQFVDSVFTNIYTTNHEGQFSGDDGQDFSVSATTMRSKLLEQSSPRKFFQQT
jgi:hypothetical protein